MPSERQPNTHHTTLRRRGGLAELARSLRKQRETSVPPRPAPARARRERPDLLLTLAAILLLVIVLSTVLWPIVRVHLQAAAVLKLVANQPVPESLRWTVGDRVAVEDLTYRASTGPVRARL